MSGSSDASTIAERTKLEQQLREAKEGLDDTYIDHSYDSISNALDNELKSYEKNANDYIESLRESIKDTDLLIESTYSKVLQNTNTVLETIYTLSSEYKFPIDENLTDPWENATQRSLDFETYAKGHIDNIWEYVETNKGKLAQSLGEPYTQRSVDVKGNPLYDFSAYAAQQIDKVIRDNTTKQGAMKDSLDGGFEQAETSIQGWDTAASGAVQNVIDKFVGNEEKGEIGLLGALNQVADRINSMPNYDGGYTTPDTNGNSTSTKTPPSTPKASPKSTTVRMQKTGSLGQEISDYFGRSQYNTANSGQVTIDGVQYYQRNTKDRNGNISTVYYKWSDNSSIRTNGMGGMITFPKGTPVYKKMYAKGTLGTKKDEWAITDESWIGEEITLAAGKNGQLQYLKKGSAVMPADISANLVEWGKLDPTMMGIGDMLGGIRMISNYVNKPEIKLDIENFLKVGAVSKDTLPELEKLMDKKIDTFAKQLNASIKKFK